MPIVLHLQREKKEEGKVKLGLLDDLNLAEFGFALFPNAKFA